MYERALEATRKIVSGTRRDQLDDATPCAGWTVRHLLNHLTNGCRAFAAGGKGEARSFEAEDQTAEDYVAAFDEASRAAVDEFNKPSEPERVFKMSRGDTPFAAALGLAIADASVHGWDLARATGQEMDIDDDIAQAIYDMTTRMMQPRGPYPRGDAFAEPAEVPDGAPIADRMVAYLGRQP